MRRTRTLRGIVRTNQGVRRLIVDDGQFTRAYRVTRFEVISADPSISSGDCYGTLALDEDGARIWNLGDNRQIGWAGQNMTASSGPDRNFSLLDPDHIVVRDLWVFGSGTGATAGYQYFVELEMIDITEDQAVLALIKERSQDDL